MQEKQLFRSRDGQWVTNTDLLRGLEEVKAHEARVLFIHTELSFGAPNPALRKKELLEEVVQVLLALEVEALCVPTFTFSFCNGVDYNVQRSKSKMGVLNEYIRKREGSVRSRDPLMSVAAMGQDLSMVQDLGHQSCGEGSTFDKLHQKGGCKFLFLGASAAKAFTYVHYVERRVGVPYRYDRTFRGLVTDGDHSGEEEYILYVRYKDVIPSERGEYEQYLMERDLMHKVPCGDSFLSTIEESIAYETTAALLDENIDFFLAQPHPRDNLDDTFEVENMVAL